MKPIHSLTMMLAGPLLCLAGAAHAAPPVLFSGFDSSLQGWTRIEDQTTSLSHAASGGNPGGYIRNTDQGPTAGDIIAPAAWLGNWSGYAGGMLRWDFRLFSAGPHDGRPFGPPVATISGPGGTAVFTSSTVPTVAAGWFNNSVPIAAANWTVTSGTWAGALANVTSFKLQIEAVFSSGFPGEVTGIDNVTLSPVPEPGSWALLLAGLAGLRGLAQRRRRNAAATLAADAGGPGAQRPLINGPGPAMKSSSILAASLLACSVGHAATFLPLDAKATYLHTFDDNPTPPPAFALDLASLGFLPGSRITLQVVGDVDNGPGGDTFTYTLGVFSSSRLLLGNAIRERVVGALFTDAPAVLSSPTFRGGRPTDIAQDFGFDIGGGITVTVPVGATTLFLAKSDQWYHDNSDPDGDYGVLISAAVVPEPGTWALMLAGLAAFGVLARRRLPSTQAHGPARPLPH